MLSEEEYDKGYSECVRELWLLDAKLDALIAAAKESREACAACFRFSAELGVGGAMVETILGAGVCEGFGVRLQDAIAEAEKALAEVRGPRFSEMASEAIHPDMRTILLPAKGKRAKE